MQRHTIRIRGARHNNLKNLSLEIPLNQITVITGVSGSGKSSLAFDTLYAEGQRRYVETFSPYARQFMDRMDRPEVDKIEHIPPSIAIDRKAPVRTSRSTLATMTGLTDYVKLLYERIGQLHCEKCERPVLRETPEHVWKELSSLPEETEIVITFPYPLSSEANGKEGEIKGDLVRNGFDRIYSEGKFFSLETWMPEQGQGVVHVVVDRFASIRPSNRKRVIDSVEQAFRFGHGTAHAWVPGREGHAFSNALECARCSISYGPPQPNLFSFNSPVGACDKCRGFGRITDIDLDLVIPDPARTLSHGAIKPWGSSWDQRSEYDDLLIFCEREKIPTDVPFQDLGEDQRRLIIDGTKKFHGIRGYFKWLETKKYKMHVRVMLSRYRGYFTCPSCKGKRFKDRALLYRISGQSLSMNIGEIYSLNVDQAYEFFSSIHITRADDASRSVLKEVKSRLKYLKDVGLDYLTLDRQSRTLSGGEVQRASLASALGTSLVNTLYVLDEPSIGLHPRDSRRLIKIMKGLRDLPNTLVVVEHDPEIISESDYLLDMGPGAGEQGGNITYFGPTSQAGHGSLTGEYLTGARRIALPEKRRVPNPAKWLTIAGAREHNLKGIDVAIPMGLFVCLTGVSGSGKSTLAEGILYRAIQRAKGDPQDQPGAHTAIYGLDQIKGAILVDQRPIGRTPRANVATYCKAMDPIRQLLGATADAKVRKLTPSSFSFNVSGGRCTTCDGEGFETVEMQFLSDVHISCPDCKGKRFKPKVLEVTYKGKNIDDILSMTADEALIFFSDQKKIVTVLTSLEAVGLGYIRLGQSINTLSGGEAQRLKLSPFIKHKVQTRKSGSGPSLFIFDEPTTGLHFSDIDKLLSALQCLVDQGNTVIVIEHNMDVAKSADWIIDLGPEGGDQGGNIVAAGPPEEVAKQRGSHTARFLKEALSQKPRLAAKPQAQASTKQESSIQEHAAPYFPIKGQEGIIVRGAKQHNLKDLSLTIPRDELVVFTGVSGSGKSTLAFDILFAEGQRRYLECLAPYVRQYLKIPERPNVDIVSGLPPTVAIEQRVSHSSRRSTVGTLTEIYHFLRLLYSKLGQQHCPTCGQRLSAQTQEQIVANLWHRFGSKRATVLAPKVAGRKGFHKEIFAQALRSGYKQARVDKRFIELDEALSLSRFKEHTIDIVIGQLPNEQLAQIVSQALKEGGGTLIVAEPEGHGGQDETLSLSGLCTQCGIGTKSLDPRLFSFNSSYGACARCDGLGVLDLENSESKVCPECKGSRLIQEALSVKIGGVTIQELTQQPIGQLCATLRSLSIPPEREPISKPIFEEIFVRVNLLERLGLSYLSLGRGGDTLSGGEAQRVRLAAQLGSTLTGVCYVLDEPTIGLHPKDHRMLLNALKELKARGNSILVVEHDEETIREADYLIDMGPGAGQEGGRVVAKGSLKDLMRTSHSVTGQCMSETTHKISSRLRPYANVPFVSIKGATEHNLKNIDIDFPLGLLVCVTGVSGSGKSTLVRETLYKGLQNRLSREAGIKAGVCADLTGWERLDRVREIDHSAIGRTPRSVPGSYVGFLSDIRDLFSQTQEARARGYGAGRFSFNVDGGRCETCNGYGTIKVEMSFLPDVYIHCEECNGARFNRETQAVTYKGRSISEVLDLTFDQAAEFFAAVPSIRRPIQFACDIGLGYLRLGQPSPTLSGGEAQRIKLIEELSKPQGRGKTLYVMDEPTTGLHVADVRRLLAVLQALVDNGNTIVMIEHNLEVISAADYIIDLGPEGGHQGGKIITTGSPYEVANQASKSYTGHHLREYLNQPVIQQIFS